MGLVVNSRRRLRLLVSLFLFALVYGLLAASVMREVVIPRMGLSVQGHLEGDPKYYHALAQTQLQKIRSGGLQSFELRPQGQGPAGISSLLYLGWNNPYSVVLVNMLLHGLSAVTMVLILMRWFSPAIAVIGSLPLFLSPYMMLWFSQVNKESYALAGVLLFTLGMLKMFGAKTYASWREPLPALVVTLAGITLLWVVRPYINQVMLPVAALGLLAASLVWLYRRQSGVRWFGAAALAILVAMALASTGAASDKSLQMFDNFSSASRTSESGVARDCYLAVDIDYWRDAAQLPGFVNRKLKALAGLRCNLFTILETQNNPTMLNSFVDQDRLPGGSLEMLAYAPRAAALGLFAPWPDRWFYTFTHGPSVFYSIAPIEALLVYLGLAGIVVWLARGGSYSILIPVALALPVIAVYGLATPFIGALYRYRYPWWMLLLGLGLAAMVDLWCRWRADRLKIFAGNLN